MKRSFSWPQLRRFKSYLFCFCFSLQVTCGGSDVFLALFLNFCILLNHAYRERENDLVRFESKIDLSALL